MSVTITYMDGTRACAALVELPPDTAEHIHQFFRHARARLRTDRVVVRIEPLMGKNASFLLYAEGEDR